MSKLEFKPETHTYLLDGIVIPSVSEIIRILYDYSSVSEELLKSKAMLGTNIHLTLEYYDKGILDEDSLHPLLNRYLNVWKRFIKDYNPEWLNIEYMAFNEKLKYAGTIDRVCLIGDSKYIIDIKTGIPNSAHKVQTMAYKLLLNDANCKRMLVYLTEDNYKVEINKNDREDTNVFYSCLTIYKFKKG